jgi:hypothetical protein
MLEAFAFPFEFAFSIQNQPEPDESLTIMLLSLQTTEGPLGTTNVPQSKDAVSLTHGVPSLFIGSVAECKSI